MVSGGIVMTESYRKKWLATMLSLVLPLLLLFAGVAYGVAQENEEDPGYVPNSWCVNKKCYPQPGYTCWDDNNDGDCDRTTLPPIQ
jgi:hypothetical protein